jgi:hypothetical protein
VSENIEREVVKLICFGHAYEKFMNSFIFSKDALREEGTP